MNTINNQRGVGLVEVLVALLVLAIGVLGFIALQYRAVEATSEAINRVQAINIARDMAERIRVNREALGTYKTEIQTADKQTSFATNCIESTCSTIALADFDVSQVVTKASDLGMSMNMQLCPLNEDGRNCIYVAWGETSATDGNGAGDCTNTNEIEGSTSYSNTSTCVIMETY